MLGAAAIPGDAAGRPFPPRGSGAAARGLSGRHRESPSRRMPTRPRTRRPASPSGTSGSARMSSTSSSSPPRSGVSDGFCKRGSGRIKELESLLIMTDMTGNQAVDGDGIPTAATGSGKEVFESMQAAGVFDDLFEQVDGGALAADPQGFIRPGTADRFGAGYVRSLGGASAVLADWIAGGWCRAGWSVGQPA